MMNVSDVYVAINEYRKENGLGKMWRSEYLEDIAQCRSYKLWREKRLDHKEIPEPSFYYPKIGEILARDFKDIKSVMRAWERSKKHKEQMDTKEYMYIGVGMKDGYICVLFGKPFWRIW